MGRRKRHVQAFTTIGGRPTVTAEFAFLLHDTYGFPIDLAVEMAAERGYPVDVDGFHRLMAEQKDRSRAAFRAKRAALIPH